MMTGKEIVELGLAARTPEDATYVQSLIAEAVGGRHQRPLCDFWGNMGALSSSGSFDHKLIENITNMQDAVVEREALRRFGEMKNIPYKDPRQAVVDLFGDRTSEQLADLINVELCDSSGDEAKKTKEMTLVFRDKGIGMTNEGVPNSIFALGSSYKNQTYWLQGSYGVGGKTTFRNARAVILITRRDPALLNPGEEDRITLAVVEWTEHGKQQSAFYLATKEWERGKADALPFSIPASEYPEFEPGTHLALIAYGVEGVYRSHGADDRGFYTVVNTRLFEPILPLRFVDSMRDHKRRREVIRGLHEKLDGGNVSTKAHDSIPLPFRDGGETYPIPVAFWVFAGSNDPGNRASYVARNHAVVFTSNGQVHHHWTPVDFKEKTSGVSKLYDRIFVVVKTDALPIEIRTRLFTADRSTLMRTDAAIRLEEQLGALLSGWDELRRLNTELVKQQITKVQEGPNTINIARQLGRSFKGLGYKAVSEGTGNNGNGSGKGKGSGAGKGPFNKPAELDLYNDPTMIEGPEKIQVVAGVPHSFAYTINAVDNFIPQRAQLQVKSDHPDIGDKEITMASLRRGKLRVMFAVPEDAQVGTFILTATLDGWLKSSGGAGPKLEWTTILEVVTESNPKPSGATRGSGGAGNGGGAKLAPGDIIPVIWQQSEESDDDPRSRGPGSVDQPTAKDIAEQIPEYAELAELGERRIWALYLNSDYRPLRDYLSSRSRDLTERGTQDARDRYAVGVGTGLLLYQDQIRKLEARQRKVDAESQAIAYESIARAVLANMPHYDQLAKEAGLEKE